VGDEDDCAGTSEVDWETVAGAHATKTVSVAIANDRESMMGMMFFSIV